MAATDVEQLARSLGPVVARHVQAQHQFSMFLQQREQAILATSKRAKRAAASSRALPAPTSHLRLEVLVGQGLTAPVFNAMWRQLQEASQMASSRVTADPVPVQVVQEVWFTDPGSSSRICQRLQLQPGSHAGASARLSSAWQPEILVQKQLTVDRLTATVQLARHRAVAASAMQSWPEIVPQGRDGCCEAGYAEEYRFTYRPVSAAPSCHGDQRSCQDEPSNNRGVHYTLRRAWKGGTVAEAWRRRQLLENTEYQLSLHIDSEAYMRETIEKWGEGYLPRSLLMKLVSLVYETRQQNL